jgi:hypothetical protein
MSNSIGQMVTCSGVDCSVCSFLNSIQFILNWLIGISAAVAVATVVYVGYSLLLRNEDKELLKKGKLYLKYAFSGFASILIAFWIFNVIYISLGAKDRNSWFIINCIQERTFSENKGQEKTSGQAAWTNNLGLVMASGSSVQELVNDSQKIIKLDLANFDANNLVLDSLKLNPDQEIKLISTDKSQSHDEIVDYVSAQKGYESGVNASSSGDRMAQESVKEILKIKIGSQGAVVVDRGTQEIVVDPSDSDKMKEFQQLLKNLLQSIRNEDIGVYAFITAIQESYSPGNSGSCEASGGTWKTFLNECEARQNVCGQKNIQCSQVKNELAGCQCPEGSCLRFGKCVKVDDISSNTDSDKDGVSDDSDRCPKTPRGEKVEQSDTADFKGCSCSQITLETHQCPVTRCEGSNLVNYISSSQDKCVNGKIINNPCNPIGIQYSPQCQDIQDANSLDKIKQIANQNTNVAAATQKWLNDMNNTMSGGSNIPRPNDKPNSWEKAGKDEGGVPSPTGKGPGGCQNCGNQNTGAIDSTGNQKEHTNNDTGYSTGGSEEARALEQKLEKIPEGILANNRGVTPYVINQCIPKLQQAAVELDEIRSGWKLYPSSIYRSDQKQTEMWDRSSQNTDMIARPKARGGRGSQHSAGNALDLKFQDSNRKVISMSSSDKALLRQVMVNAGMIPYDKEWWHFYCIPPFRF